MKALKYILSIATLGLLMTGCQEFDDPAPFTPAEMEANTTIQQLKAKYNGITVINDPNMIVAGKVISNDKEGNHYRTFFIQDETGGIEIKVGRTTLYNTYKEGQTIYVKPHGLCLGNYGGMISVGYPSTNPQYENSWIDAPAIINQTIFRGAMGAAVEPTVIANSSGLVAANVGKLVEVQGLTYSSGSYRYDGVTYSGLTTWAKKDDINTQIDESAYGEHVFTLAGGGQVMVRTSGYAKFAETEIPEVIRKKEKTVNITGILTIFNSTYQLILNTNNDVVIQ